MRGTITVPIEYFVWASQSSNQERLIYYDENGNCIEHTVKAGAVQAALKVFDGRARTVHRSTGGMTRVEPYQLVLVNHEDGRLPSIRVRVRFTDVRFVQGENGQVIAQVYQHSKVVAPEQLQETFDYELIQDQRFVVDFGQGILPVQVIHLDRDDKDQVNAYFIDPGDASRIAQGNLGDRAWIQVYEVPRETLRHADIDDWRLALGNYERIKRHGSEMIPDCLRSSFPIETISGYQWEDLRDFLQLTLSQRKDENSLQPVFQPLSMERDKESMPAGISGPKLMRT